MLDLNLMMIISLTVLALFSIVFFIVLIPIALQLSRTLSSAQRLIDTVNDFEAEVKEIKHNIQNVKVAVKQGGTIVKANVDEAGVILVSSMYGILAGIKEYFLSYKKSENSYNSNSSMGIKRKNNNLK